MTPTTIWSTRSSSSLNDAPWIRPCRPNAPMTSPWLVIGKLRSERID
jgi:hypothetical protein